MLHGFCFFSGPLRFLCLTTTRRNCDISLFHQNTKNVFSFKSSNISVSKRSSPLFVSRLRGPNPPAVSPFRLRQKASPSKGLQHPADLNGPTSLFLRSSCSGQGLDRFTLSNEHKERVLLIGLQRLSRLNGRFRFSCLATTRRNCDISLFHQNTKNVFSFKSSNISVSKRSSPLFDEGRVSIASPYQMNTKSVFF